MSFEDDVLSSVHSNRVSHLRFYVDEYLGGSSSERALWRSNAIQHENTWVSRSSFESARLKVVEFLDSHRNTRHQVTAFVEALHRIEHQSTMGPESGPSLREVVAITQEGLHRLEGGFIGALIQGVANEIWHDNPAMALDKAAPLVTVGDLIMAHGDAMKAHSERIGDIRHPLEIPLEVPRTVGQTELERTLDQIGSKTPAEHFPNTAHEFAEMKIEGLQQHFGAEGAMEISKGLAPGEGVPGASDHALGDMRSPETFANDADKNIESGSDKGHVAPHSSPQSYDPSSAPDNHVAAHSGHGGQVDSSTPNFTDSTGHAVHVDADPGSPPQSYDSSSAPDNHVAAHSGHGGQVDSSTPNFTDSTGHAVHVDANPGSPPQSYDSSSAPDNHVAAHSGHGGQVDSSTPNFTDSTGHAVHVDANSATQDTHH